MSRLHLPTLLIIIASLILAGCDVPGGPEAATDAAPKATAAPLPTAVPPTAAGPTSQPAPTTVVEVPSPEATLAETTGADLLGLTPPLNAAQLCGLLTPAEIETIQGWAWEPATVSTANTCAYGTVDLHTGAYIRLTNSRFTREEFLGFYPTAAQFDGLVVADSDQDGDLDDIWLALTPEAALHVEFFATRLTEEQALQMVEALFS